jgi:hypothetical protein
MAKDCLLQTKVFIMKLIKRKRTTKNGKLVVSANSNEQQKVKFYDKKKEDVLSPPIYRLKNQKNN